MVTVEWRCRPVKDFYGDSSQSCPAHRDPHLRPLRFPRHVPLFKLSTDHSYPREPEVEIGGLDIPEMAYMAM